MDDKSFTIRVPKRWVRVAMIVGVTALIVAPLAAIAADSFTDVANSNTFHDDIAAIADVGVTKGCNPPVNDEYCPNDNVTRGQMAAFMNRLGALGPGKTPVVNAATAEEADHAANADNADNAATLDGYGMPNFLGAQVTTHLAEVPVPDGGNASAQASCDTGEVLIGGGGALSLFVSDVSLLSSRPIPLTDGSTPTQWQASARNPGGGTGSIDVRAWAVCASFPDTPITSTAEKGVAEPEPGQP